MTATFPGGTPGDPGYWEVVFDVIPFPVYVVDVKTLRIICANRAMRQKSAATEGDICHAAVYGLDAPCSFCKITTLDGAVGANGNSLVFEHFNEQDDCWYQLRETMVTWIDGRKAKYCVAVDISALKDVQNALAEAHAELSIKNRSLNVAIERERNAMRGQRNFLAMVSHEFRTPLAVIDGAGQLLDHYVGDNAEAADELAKIRRAGGRMSELIDACLSEDRLESTEAVLHQTEVDLASLLGEVLADKRPLTGPDRLKAGIGGRPVLRGDPALLRVAISNLIDNALKYSPATEPVEIRLSVDDNRVSVAVLDRGMGVAESERSRIFEKFFRSTGAEGVRGAGLGLFIVKRIADLHRGRVTVGGRPDGGSVFTLTLALEDGAGE